MKNSKIIWCIPNLAPHWERGKDEIDKFVEKCELDLTTLNGNEAKSMLNWYTTNSSTAYKGLRLSGAKYLIQNYNRLWKLLQLELFRSLRSLYLDHCSLREVPGIMHLKLLEVLVLSKNNITNIKTSQIPLSVNLLQLEANPIKHLDLELSLLNELKEVKIGSEQMRFISFAMLQGLRKQVVNIEVPVEYRDALLMPSFEILNAIMLESQDSCHSYMHNPEMYLNKIKSRDDREEALEWLLENRPRTLTTLTFVGQSWINDQTISKIVGKSSLDHVGMLNLSSCQLTYIPNLCIMKQLAVLDVRNNRLESLMLDKCPSGLTQLFVSGNLIGTIDFNPDSVPNLEKLEIGSKNTEFVSVRLLRKRNINKIIVVKEEYRNNLIFPTWRMLNDQRDKMYEIVSSTTVNVTWLDKNSRKDKFVDWILKQEMNITCIDLSSQAKLTSSIGHNKLQHYMSHQGTIGIVELKMDSCDLTKLPSLDNLVNLKCLSVRHNSLNRISQSRSIEILDISGNQNAYNNLKEDCPNLKKVIIGHLQLKYLDFDFLKFVADQAIEIVVPDEYKNSIVMPPRDLLDNRDELQRYLLCPELFLKKVDTDQMTNAFNWLVGESKFSFSSLTMSNMSAMINESHFGLILQEESLLGIHTLILDNCNLCYIPDVSGLTNLNCLSMDQNIIESLASLKSTRLRKLSIVENPIISININMDNCKQLRELTIGSYRTKYIGLSVLKQASKIEDPLVLNIEKAFEQNVILPPYKTIQRGPECILQYISEGTFDITGFSKLYSANEKVLLDALKHDERQIRRMYLSKGDSLLKVCDQKTISNILSHKSLQSLDSISICNTNLVNNITCFRHETVTSLDLGGSFIGDDVRLDILMQGFPRLESLLLRNCNITSACTERKNDTLQYLDLRSNRIKRFEISHEMTSLRSIHLEDNSIRSISIREDCLPKLSELVMGSHYTRYIGFDLLQRKQTGQLHLKVLRQYTKALQMPSYAILNNNDNLQRYLKSPEKQIAGINDTCFKEEALNWLLDNKSGKFTELNMSNLTMSLSRVLNHTKVQSVEVLDLSNCSLTECPPVNHLYSLRHLNLSDNRIKGKGLVTLNLPRLEHLDISNCPIKTVSLSSMPCSSSKLHLIIGSKETRYIAMSLLKRASEGQISLEVTEKFQSKLMFPPFRCLRSTEQLANFIKNPEKELLSFEKTEQTIDTLNSMLKSDIALETLNLPGYATIYEDYGNRWLNAVLGSPSLNEIKVMKLASCNLSRVPDITPLLMLQELDLSNNKLEKIHLRLEFSNMKRIVVTGNPLERMELVDFGQGILPNLKEIECGSSETKYIGLPILQRAAQGKLTIVVPIEYRECLIVPPYRLLEEGPAALNECVKHPEKYLKGVDGLDDKKNTLLWLRDTGSHDKESFDLSGQTDICEDHNVLNSLLDSPKLSCIKHLNLSDCGLWTLPDLTHFKHLVTLNFSFNRINTIDYKLIPDSVVKLTVTGNSIEVLNVNFQTHTKLTSIEAGSDHLRFLPSNVLTKYCDGDFKVTIKEKIPLLLPPWEVFNKPSSIEQYLNQPEYFLRYIIDVKDQQKALTWLVESDGQAFNKEFTLSDQYQVCSAFGFAKLVKMFEHPAFKTLKRLSLDGCGLNEVPGLSNLTQLKVLNLTQNNISAIQQNLQLKQVEELYIDQNPVVTVDFELLQTFPSLKVLKLGAAETKFVALGLLKQCKERDVSIKVNEKYQKVLLFPSFEYMQNASSKLDNDDNFPKGILDALQMVENKHEMLHWLLEDDRNKFSTFCFSHLTDVWSHCNQLGCKSFLTMKSLRDVKCLYLDHCGFDKIPKLDNSPKLKDLHLEYNRIEDVSSIFPLEKLECLQLQGNPIADYGDFSALPSLCHITLGSSVARFLDQKLLEKMQAGLRISIDEQFRNNLLLPPASLVSPRKIQGFLQHPKSI